MKNFFNKYQVYVYGVLFFVSVVLIVNNTSEKPFLGNFFINMISPVQEKITDSGRWANENTNFVLNLFDTHEDNKKLKKEVAELKNINFSTAEIWAENKRLHEMLNYKNEQKQFNLVVAKVIGRAPGQIKADIIVNKGNKDGLKENMPVITSEGLVGYVAAVYDNAAQINLLTHPESSVGGMVQRANSRAVGVVNGRVINEESLQLVNLARDADVREDDVIITSGFGGRFPKGILIGTVTKVENADGGLLKIAVIDPSVTFNKLEEVMVITNAEQAPEVAVKLPPAIPATTATTQAVPATTATTPTQSQDNKSGVTR